MEDLNRLFLQRKHTNGQQKHMRCYSISLIIREMQVTNTVRCQNAREGVEKKESSYTVGRNIIDTVIIEKSIEMP